MPAAPGLIILGSIFFVGMFLAALSQASNSTTRPAGESQGILSGLTWATQVFGDLWHKLFRATISRFAVSHLVPLVRWFGAANALVLGSATTVADVADEAATAIEQTNLRIRSSTTYKDGATVKAKASTASSTAATAKTAAHATSTSLHNYRVATRPKLTHYSTAIDSTLPWALPRTRTRVGTLEREYDDLRGRTKALEDGALDTWKWIRSHPLSAVTGVFTAAVAIALSRLGFGFARCRSWRNVGKGLTCNMGNDVGALLGLAATAAAVSQFRELVKIAQAVEHETVVGIKDLAGL